MLYEVITDMALAQRHDVAALRREPLSVFEPAQFLERVDRDMAVGSDRDMAAAHEVMMQREQAVPEVRFGTRAQHGHRAARRERLRFLVVSYNFV